MQWLEKFRRSDSKTHWFYFNWWIYLIAIIATTVYIYARLEFDRSGPAPTEETRDDTKRS